MIGFNIIGKIGLCLISLLILSCEFGNSPNEGQQNAALVGCWELQKVDSVRAGGHKINLLSHDSAYFTALTFPFNDSVIGEVNKRETKIDFQKWVYSNDSLRFVNGNGKIEITYPDSTIKMDSAKTVNVSFGLSFKNDTLNLFGKWFENSNRKYEYVKCAI